MNVTLLQTYAHHYLGVVHARYRFADATGQTIVEYIGMCAVIVAIVIAFGTHADALGNLVNEKMQGLINKAAGAGGGGGGGGNAAGGGGPGAAQPGFAPGATTGNQ